MKVQIFIFIFYRLILDYSILFAQFPHQVWISNSVKTEAVDVLLLEVQYRTRALVQLPSIATACHTGGCHLPPQLSACLATFATTTTTTVQITIHNMY